jgi:hypothetical protein
MTGTFTRRKLAAALVAPAAAALAQPQTPSAAAAGDELKAARERLGSEAAALARQELPMAAEPAFRFEA